MNTLAGTETAIAEFVLDGNVTWNVLYIIFAVVVFTATFVWWVMHNFQTKAEANLAEARQKDALAMVKVDFEEAIDGMHAHMKNMRDDTKTEIRQVQADVSGIRASLTSIANDLGYLRGKADK